VCAVGGNSTRRIGGLAGLKIIAIEDVVSQGEEGGFYDVTVNGGPRQTMECPPNTPINVLGKQIFLPDGYQILGQ
jgi:hypothetical protein